MQTFLPSPDFVTTARLLDRGRLGKQRVETLQILRTLLGAGPGGWGRHPAVRMWAGFEGALGLYGLAICEEWVRRGYRDTCTEKILALVGSADPTDPPWLGDPRLHASHRSNLRRKDPIAYPFEEDPALPYLWPALGPGRSYVLRPGAS